jgi:hypothetical protein
MNRRQFLKAAAALAAATQVPMVLGKSTLPPWEGWPAPWNGSDYTLMFSSDKGLGVYGLNEGYAVKLFMAKDKANFLAWLAPECKWIRGARLGKKLGVTFRDGPVTGDGIRITPGEIFCERKGGIVNFVGDV